MPVIDVDLLGSHASDCNEASCSNPGDQFDQHAADPFDDLDRMLDDLGGSDENIDSEPNLESSSGPSDPNLLLPAPGLSSSFPRLPPPGLDNGKHINHDNRDPPRDMLEPSGLVIQQSGDPNNWRHPHDFYDRAKSRSSNNSNSNSSTAITINVEPALLDQNKLVKFDRNIDSSKYVSAHSFSDAQIQAARQRIAGTSLNTVSLASKPTHILINNDSVDQEHGHDNQQVIDLDPF